MRIYPALARRYRPSITNAAFKTDISRQRQRGEEEEEEVHVKRCTCRWKDGRKGQGRRRGDDREGEHGIKIGIGIGSAIPTQLSYRRKFRTSKLRGMNIKARRRGSAVNEKPKAKAKDFSQHQLHLVNTFNESEGKDGTKINLSTRSS